MSLYAKIWTDIENDEWFIGLKCIERGVFLQLPVLAKNRGDSGEISFRSWRLLSENLGLSVETSKKILHNFDTSSKIRLTELPNGTVRITILNYHKHQHLRKYGSGGGRQPGPVEKSSKNRQLNRAEHNSTLHNSTEHSSLNSSKKNCYGDAVTEKSQEKKSEPPPPDRKPRHDSEEEFRREELSRFVDILRTYVPVAKNTPKPELYKFAAWFSARFRSESEPVRVAEHVVRYRMKYFLELKTWKDVYAYATRVDQDPETINEARSRAYKSITPVDVGLDKKPP